MGIVGLIVVSLFVLLIGFIIYYYVSHSNGLRIFMYHQVGAEESESNYYLHRDMFIKQLELLKSKGYKIVSLSEVEQAFETKQKLSGKPVMLTFDDGWEDNYIYAFPIIKQYNIPITIFINPGLLGNKDILNSEQIIEMQNSGLVQFSSHGQTHQRLRSLSDDEVLKELKDSKEFIEKNFTFQVKSFCYPYGAFDKRVRKLVFKAGYKYDFGTRKGINIMPYSGRRPLKRRHILKSDSLKDFERKLTVF